MGSKLDTHFIDDYNRHTFLAALSSNSPKTVALISPTGAGRNAEATNECMVRSLIAAISNAGKTKITNSLNAALAESEASGNPVSAGGYWHAQSGISNPELADLTAIRTYWTQKGAMLDELLKAVDAWCKWNNEILEFYSTKLLDSVRKTLQDVKYKSPSDATRDIKITDGNLSSMFEFIASRKLYDVDPRHGAETLNSANTVKDEATRSATSNLDTLIDATWRNTNWARELMDAIKLRKKTYETLALEAAKGYSVITNTPSSVSIAVRHPEPISNLPDPNSLNPRSMAGG